MREQTLPLPPPYDLSQHFPMHEGVGGWRDCRRQRGGIGKTLFLCLGGLFSQLLVASCLAGLTAKLFIRT